MVALLRKRTFDGAACTPEGVKVFFNNAHVKVKRFLNYAVLYVGKPCDAPRVEHCTNRWKVALAWSGSKGKKPRASSK